MVNSLDIAVWNPFVQLTQIVSSYPLLESILAIMSSPDLEIPTFPPEYAVVQPYSKIMHEVISQVPDAAELASKLTTVIAIS